MKSPTKGIDIVLKISERCNLACTYCYFFFQEMDTFKENTAVIKMKTIDQLVEFINKGYDELGIQSINIGLHGGEPLLIKKEHFSSICNRLRENITPEVHVNLMCQTNGTLVDSEWISIFEQHKVNVGVSIDGPKHINDKYRIDHNGKGSYDQTVRGIKLLQQAQKDNKIPSTGSLCVANVKYNGKELVKHIHEDIGINDFDLLFPREGHDSDIKDQQDDWKTYYKDIIDYWLSKKDRSNLRISSLNKIFNALISEASAEVLDEQKSMQHNIINISSEGQIGIDDNILSLDKRLLDKNKTIFNTSMKEFISSPIWQELIKAVDTKPQACKGCEWYRTCRSGALFNRYQKSNGFDNNTVFCETMDYIHISISEKLVQHGLKVSEIAKILDTPPQFLAKDGINSNVLA
ncbi:Arylsulfatase regulator (Fe-S oxidoreductase) [Shewanella piezotolerans WP3]|uniref:Arylsulfatase regulator (Fe-S oxidoreductase) n=1 Tax=Shewanella piezotolerans (strain WP3 / JCM 13877) TaxID=225849 RepID=B8CJ75_SHEPW|nr:radical SAM protein [Shewanella piezotolerans]ACJ27837.1 Arylsulfatase regulator (Fe-S oxidoreductase) [Shewanella piezotolerans WP3]